MFPSVFIICIAYGIQTCISLLWQGKPLRGHFSCITTFIPQSAARGPFLCDIMTLICERFWRGPVFTLGVLVWSRNTCAKFHQNRLKTVASRPELTDIQTDIRRKNKFPNASNRRLRSLRSLSQLWLLWVTAITFSTPAVVMIMQLMNLSAIRAYSFFILRGHWPSTLWIHLSIRISLFYYWLLLESTMLLLSKNKNTLFIVLCRF